MTRRVRAADPESAELADVAISSLTVLELIWAKDEDCPPVADFWRRIRTAVEVAPVADLLTALHTAHGLRDLHRRCPELDDDLEEVAARVEQRAWDRERKRLGVSPKVGTTG